MEWIDDPLRPARSEIWAKRGEPDPAAIDLHPANEDAARVYMLTRQQVITAGRGQVVDISIPAVKIAMDLYGVRDQAKCLNRVRKLFHHRLEAQQRES